MQSAISRSLTHCLFSCVLFAAAPVHARAASEFYVSILGNDAWTGRLPAPNAAKSDGPFRTLDRARDAIRRLRDSGGPSAGQVFVSVRGGVYSIANTLELSITDSGSAEAPVIYRAFEDEKVRLIGGREIRGFRPITERVILDRLDESARRKVLQVDLGKLGVTDFGRMRPRGFGRPTHPAGLELFFDNEPMQLARWPNEGWVTIADVPQDAKDGFAFEGDRPIRWANAKDVWVHGYWKQDWADSYESVASVDIARKLIITREPHGVYGYTKGKRYYALNILGELDSPGEWYLDRDSGILYFWPPSPMDESDAFVSILEAPIVSMKNVSHVRLEGFRFECTRGTAVVIDGGTGNVVSNCTFRNIGNRAVEITGGTHNGVANSHIYNTGDGGVVIRGGDRKTLTPASNYAHNNHIHNYSRWVRTYCPAIKLSGVGNRVTHCLIHDAPHTGILFGGNEHLLEFNEVHSICRETGDVGAFYTGRDWTTRGTVIRYNYFHDIHGPYTHGAMAVYLDDAASGTTIYGNVFYKASRAAFIGGGRDNLVENNIFVECYPAVHIDARGLGWAKGYIAKGGGWHMYRKLNDVNHDKPPYSTHYPQLAKILQDDPPVPKGNIVRRNVSKGGRWIDLQGVDKNIVTSQDNFTEGDPRLADIEARNFQLRDDSPAYEMGFKKIPIEAIGLTSAHDGP